MKRLIIFLLIITGCGEDAKKISPETINGTWSFDTGTMGAEFTITNDEIVEGWYYLQGFSTQALIQAEVESDTLRLIAPQEQRYLKLLNYTLEGDNLIVNGWIYGCDTNSTCPHESGSEVITLTRK